MDSKKPNKTLWAILATLLFGQYGGLLHAIDWIGRGDTAASIAARIPRWARFLDHPLAPLALILIATALLLWISKTPNPPVIVGPDMQPLRAYRLPKLKYWFGTLLTAVSLVIVTAFGNMTAVIRQEAQLISRNDVPPHLEAGYIQPLIHSFEHDQPVCFSMFYVAVGKRPTKGGDFLFKLYLRDSPFSAPNQQAAQEMDETQATDVRESFNSDTQHYKSLGSDVDAGRSVWKTDCLHLSNGDIDALLFHKKAVYAYSRPVFDGKPDPKSDRCGWMTLGALNPDATVNPATIAFHNCIPAG